MCGRPISHKGRQNPCSTLGQQGDRVTTHDEEPRLAGGPFTTPNGEPHQQGAPRQNPCSTRPNAASLNRAACAGGLLHRRAVKTPAAPLASRESLSQHPMESHTSRGSRVKTPAAHARTTPPLIERRARAAYFTEGPSKAMQHPWPAGRPCHNTRWRATPAGGPASKPLQHTPERRLP